MDTKQFLQRVLGGDGRYCTFAVRKSDDSRRQEFHTSIDDLLGRAYELDADGYDVFYGLATFGSEDRRRADNALSMQAMFIDLDCGPTKDYPSQREALDALKKFCGQLDLPKPQLVNSGRGIHAYWFLAESVSVAEWRGVAERLKKACEAKKLYADPAVTSDAARVLRVPGTHNYKGDPLRVQVLGNEFVEPITLDAFSAKLEVFTPAAKVDVQQSSALMNALAGNKESSFKKIIDKTKAGEGCAQLEHIIRHQDSIDESLWRAGLSITKFTVEGEKAAHVISKRHPDYDPDETLAKFSNIKGPYLCSSFDEYNPGVCQDCPNWGKIKSPITIGNRVKEPESSEGVAVVGTLAAREAEPQTFIIPPFPAPYFRGANGGVYKKVQGDEEGDDDVKLIHPDDFYIVRRIRDPELKDCILLRAHCHMDGVREFVIPQRMLVTRDDFRKALADEGVTILRNVDEVLNYMDAWVQELRRTSKQDNARRQFGFTDESGTSFVLGSKEYYADRIADNAPTISTTQVLHLYEPKGTLEGWKETMEFLNRPGQELFQYVMCASAGSILMHKSTVHAMLTHVWSKGSGLGKTTAMLAGASIWGHPKGQIMGESDTDNAKMMQGELNKNLPLFLDEITNMGGRALSQLAYQFTGGSQKKRMKGSRNEFRHQGSDWKLLAVSTGNTSVVERISAIKAMPKAEAQRVLEIRAERVFKEVSDKPLTDKFNRDIFEHYGHVGPILVQYYMRNREEVDKLVENLQLQLDRRAALTAENRYWSEGVSRVLAGGLLLKKLGLVNFDMAALFKWCLKAIIQNKTATDADTSTAESIAAEYIQSRWANTLRIKSTEDRRGKENGNGLDQLVMPEATPRGAFIVRYETDTNRWYFLASDFKAWCIEQQINYAQLCEELAKDMKATRMKMRMGKGTSTITPPVTTISFVSDRLAGDAEDGDATQAPIEEG